MAVIQTEGLLPESDWPHEVIKRAAIHGGYKRESYKDGRAPTWTLDEEALINALEAWARNQWFAAGVEMMLSEQ